MNKQALEQGYDGQIKMIKDILSMEFTGATFEEKKQFVDKHRPALDKIVDVTLTSMHDVFTGQVKVFRLNDCDWVAAKSLDEAKEHYLNVTGISEEDAFDNPYEEDLETFEITLENLDESHVDYRVLKHLQLKYSEPDKHTYKAPVSEILAVEWQGTPYIIASTEY